jgi:predicted RNA-binding Zn ribbon-like protein
MDFTHYEDECLQVAPDLVNTQGSVSGHEYLTDADALRAFFADHDLEAPAEISEADLERIREVRDRLRAAFEAPDQAATAAILNDLISRAGAQPYVTDHDGRWHIHYSAPEASAAERLTAIAAMSLAVVMSEFGWERLGVCGADNCADAYIDTSRNRSRRYCSSSCGSRSNVAAYRARHKHKAEA